MRGGGRLSADRKPPIPGREPCPGDTAKPDAKHPQPSGLLHRTLGTNSACCNHRERLGIDGRRARELTFEGGCSRKRRALEGEEARCAWKSAVFPHRRRRRLLGGSDAPRRREAEIIQTGSERPRCRRDQPIQRSQCAGGKNGGIIAVAEHAMQEAPTAILATICK